MISPINQLRADRRQGMQVWCADTESLNRWTGDDGRLLMFDERVLWPQVVKDASDAKFAALDVAYEASKALL